MHCDERRQRAHDRRRRAVQFRAQFHAAKPALMASLAEDAPEDVEAQRAAARSQRELDALKTPARQAGSTWRTAEAFVAADSRRSRSRVSDRSRSTIGDECWMTMSSRRFSATRAPGLRCCATTLLQRRCCDTGRVAVASLAGDEARARGRASGKPPCTDRGAQLDQTVDLGGPLTARIQRRAALGVEVVAGARA